VRSSQALVRRSAAAPVEETKAVSALASVVVGTDTYRHFIKIFLKWEHSQKMLFFCFDKNKTKVLT
jgi:hypothetical protein